MRPPVGDALHGGDGAARRRLLLRHHVGGFVVGAVAVGLRRLGAQHQRQHRLGAEEAREEAQRAHAERQRAACAARRRPRAGAAPSARRDVPRRPRVGGTRRVARSSAYSASPRNNAPPLTSSAYIVAQPRCASRRRACRRASTAAHGTSVDVARVRHVETFGSRASVADFPEAQALRCAYPSCRVAVARAQDAAGCRRGGSCPTPTSTSVPTIERTICQQNAVAGCRSAARRRRGRASATRAPGASWSSPRDPCGRTRRSRARRGTGRRRAAAARGRAAPAPTTRCGRGTGRARRGSRSCSGTRATARSGGRRSRRRRARRRAPRPRARAGALTARATCRRRRRRRRPAATPPGPTRARRRRCARRTSSSSRRAAARARARRAARPRPCAARAARRSRGSRCRRTRPTSLSTRSPTSLVARLRRAEAGSHQFDARHGRVVTGARAELQDAQVAAADGRGSAARSRRTACA